MSTVPLLWKFFRIASGLAIGIFIFKPGMWQSTNALLFPLASEPVLITRDGPVLLFDESEREELLKKYPEASFLIPPERVGEIEALLNVGHAPERSTHLRVSAIASGQQTIVVEEESKSGWTWKRYEVSEKEARQVAQARFHGVELSFLAGFALFYYAIVDEVWRKVIRPKWFPPR